MNNKKHLYNYIRKIIKEVLDYNEKDSIKKSKTNIFDNEFEPLGGNKVVNLGDDNVIKISFLIDDYENAIEISFTDNLGSFNLTNANIISKLLNTVTYQTKDFLKLLNKKMLKDKKQLTINKIIIHPTKIKDSEENLKALDTKRGKIFTFFINKIMKISSIVGNNNKITYNLSKPFKFGYDKDEFYF